MRSPLRFTLNVPTRDMPHAAAGGLGCLSSLLPAGASVDQERTAPSGTGPARRFRGADAVEGAGSSPRPQFGASRLRRRMDGASRGLCDHAGVRPESGLDRTWLVSSGTSHIVKGFG